MQLIIPKPQDAQRYWNLLNQLDYETTFNWVTMIIILITSAFSGFFSLCICEVIETLNEIKHNTAITAKNSGK